MGDKRISNIHNAINHHITGIMQISNKAKPHEIAYALIESAFWVMAEEESHAQYLEEAFHEASYWASRGKE